MNRIKLIFVGDIYIEDSKNPAKLVGHSVENLFKKSDVVGGNFEGPLQVLGDPISKAGTILSQAPGAAQLVARSGFNVINLANNHIFDYGKLGLIKTLRAFKNCTTLGAGVDFQSAYSLKTLKIRGLTIGFLSYGESEFGAIRDTKQKSGGFAWVNHSSVEAIVRDSKKKADILIVQIHAGIEEIDFPLPEWREKYRELIDWGADIVIGHHPHVPQGWEEYKQKMIFYSLGNFNFRSAKIKTSSWGIMTAVTFIGKKLEKVKIIPVEINEGCVEIGKADKYKNILKELNMKLKDGSYNKEVDSMCLKLWQTRYKKYYYDATGGFIGRIFGRVNSLLLLHNLRIESHRWLVERALTLLSG